VKKFDLIDLLIEVEVQVVDSQCFMPRVLLSFFMEINS